MMRPSQTLCGDRDRSQLCAGPIGLRGDAYYYKGDYDRAVADYDVLVRLDPRPLFYRYRGMIHEKKGDLARAIGDYGEAIRLDPKDIPALNFRGLIAERSGNLGSAAADFAAVLAIDPNHSGAQERLARVQQRLSALAKLGRSRRPAARATAEMRVALVIGNSAYASVGALPNPRNDAEKVAATLKRIGFEVTLAVDLTRDKLAAALKTFRAQADRADWAVVYYAGHGIEFGGTNYLIPIDARLASDRDISFEALALDDVLLTVEGAKKMRLAILDACRDNPFIKSMARSQSTRSVGRGLAQVEPEGATLIAFAAKHGRLALDGEGTNSPFVTALVGNLDTPGLEINLLFRKVRDDVLKMTGGRQEPYMYGSLPAEAFYFRR